MVGLTVRIAASIGLVLLSFLFQAYAKEYVMGTIDVIKVQFESVKAGLAEPGCRSIYGRSVKS